MSTHNLYWPCFLFIETSLRLNVITFLRCCESVFKERTDIIIVSTAICIFIEKEKIYNDLTEFLFTTPFMFVYNSQTSVLSKNVS